MLVESSVSLTAELNLERGDMLMRGLGVHSANCVSDTQLCSTHHPSYANRKPSNILKSAEMKKKRKCLSACSEEY